MRKLNALLERADEGLRALLLGRRLPAGLLAMLTYVAFSALMMTRMLAQLAGVSAAARVWGVQVLCLPLEVMLLFALRLTKERSTLEQLGAFALCALAMLARVSFIERSSGDYDIYLADWIARLAAGSFREGMQANIGEYNVLYQYILFVITRLGVPALYAVKAVSFVGDAFLAGACAKLAGRKNALAAFGAALLLPTLVLNGGMFAQCDSLYAACALWGLALALDNRPASFWVAWKKRRRFSSTSSRGSKGSRNSFSYSAALMPTLVRSRSIRYSPARSRMGISSISSMMSPPSRMAAM